MTKILGPRLDLRVALPRRMKILALLVVNVQGNERQCIGLALDNCITELERREGFGGLCNGKGSEFEGKHYQKAAQIGKEGPKAKG